VTAARVPEPASSRSCGGGRSRAELAGLFELVLIPLAAMPLLSRRLERPTGSSGSGGGRRHPGAAKPPPGPCPSRPATAALAGLPAHRHARLVTSPANTLPFAYSESVLGLRGWRPPRWWWPPASSASAGWSPGGGRPTAWPEVTAGRTQAVIALAATLTYSGSPAAAIARYLLAIIAASVFAPATGATAAELFPTSIRATVAGWMSVAGILGAVSGLVLFGVLVTALNSSWIAAAWSRCRCSRPAPL
jgi:hypothetical protein